MQSPRLGGFHVSGSAFPFPHAFSWTTALNWDWIKTFAIDTEAMVQSQDWLPLVSKALSYQAHPISTIGATSDVNTSFAQHLVFVLLNNIQFFGELDLKDIHGWVGRLPQPIILQLFKALPPEHSDVLRERLFTQALDEGDVSLVQSILRTGFDLTQPIEFAASGHPQLPLHRALDKHHNLIVEAIVKQLSCTRSADFVLAHITNTLPNRNFGPTCGRLIQRLIDAGAKPTYQCLRPETMKDLKLMRKILENFDGGVQGWVQAGILKHCLQWINFFMVADLEVLIKPMFSYILQEKLDEIQSHDPTISLAISAAFRAASSRECIWAMNMLVDAALHLGVRLGNPKHTRIINLSEKLSHRGFNFLLFNELRKRRDEHLENTDEGETQSYEGLVTDWNQLIRRLNEYQLSVAPIRKVDILNLLASGCAPGFEDIMAALAVELDRTEALKLIGVINMLNQARIPVISQFISQHQKWNQALLCVRNKRSFDALDDLLHRRQILWGGVMIRCLSSASPSVARQLELRILSYYAIDKNLEALLRWLLRTEISPYALWGLGSNTGGYHALIERTTDTPPSNGNFFYHTINLPSLLASAASQNNACMTQVLLNEGVPSKDSHALMWAVAGNADKIIIDMLLTAAGRVHCKKNYGGGALRAAIFRKDYDMLYSLSAKVDVNSIESLAITDLNGAFIEKDPLSPIGEAILSKDLEAVEILVKNGANVNGLVSRDHYITFKFMETGGTIMKRATTLLAAIDIEHLPMVRLLVESGADVNHSFNPGLIRTPLQRAAEIGNFEIVQYLLERGAPADSAPCYSGGTPLQLTAIGGYVGIAELLLEHGADINHLPAKGEGRTAFEGAAEWSRVDMMSLLVSRNLNFDLVVDNEGHTQYERAMYFAEKRGAPASKRFVQRLRVDSAVDVINLQAVMGE
jgi:hypothetical protein